MCQNHPKSTFITTIVIYCALPSITICYHLLSSIICSHPLSIHLCFNVHIHIGLISMTTSTARNKSIAFARALFSWGKSSLSHPSLCIAPELRRVHWITAIGCLRERKWTIDGWFLMIYLLHPVIVYSYVCLMINYKRMRIQWYGANLIWVC